MKGIASAVGILVLPLVLASGARADDVEESASRLGLDVQMDAPTSIRSEELEASRDDRGREHVIFQRGVVVEQGDLTILCDWLEATYPKEGKGIERLVARGNVRILQGESEVRCTEAVFDPNRQRVVCKSTKGPATLRRGGDVVEGKEIIFDLARSSLRVSGGATVRMQPKEAAP